MNNFDDNRNIFKLDKSNTLESIKNLPQQIQSAWKESRQVKFPSEYFKINNILVS